MVKNDGEIARHKIALPMLDIHTIGAGGGSIGWLDEGGLLRMGPAERRRRPRPGLLRQGRQAARPRPTPTSCSATSTRTSSPAGA
jgi:N-methylhydantoinase A/oxoprolinase/acetone carboxylase beta subunit